MSSSTIPSYVSTGFHHSTSPVPRLPSLSPEPSSSTLPPLLPAPLIKSPSYKPDTDGAPLRRKLISSRRRNYQSKGLDNLLLAAKLLRDEEQRQKEEERQLAYRGRIRNYNKALRNKYAKIERALDRASTVLPGSSRDPIIIRDDTPEPQWAVRANPPGIPQRLIAPSLSPSGLLESNLLSIRLIKEWYASMEDEMLLQMNISPFQEPTVEQMERRIRIPIEREYPVSRML